MKTIFRMILPLMGVIMINSACSDDDENNNLPTEPVTSVNATVIGVADKVDNVLLTIGNSGMTVYSESEFKNNTFEFSLEKEVGASYLKFLSTMQDFEKMSFTDSSAKACYGEFYASKDGKATGVFAFTDGPITENKYISNDVYYIYVDRDVEMTGKQEKNSVIINASCSFKKGWNLFAIIHKVSKWDTESSLLETTYTTAIPTGVRWE